MDQASRRVAEIVRDVTAIQSKDISTLTMIERVKLNAWSQARMLLTMGELVGGSAKSREARGNLHTLGDRCRHAFKRVTGAYVREERQDDCRKAVAFYDEMVGVYQGLAGSAKEKDRLDQAIRENNDKMRALYEEQCAQYKAAQARVAVEATVLQQDIRPLQRLKLRMKA